MLLLWQTFPFCRVNFTSLIKISLRNLILEPHFALLQFTIWQHNSSMENKTCCICSKPVSPYGKWKADYIEIRACTDKNSDSSIKVLLALRILLSQMNLSLSPLASRSSQFCQSKTAPDDLHVQNTLASTWLPTYAQVVPLYWHNSFLSPPPLLS